MVKPIVLYVVKIDFDSLTLQKFTRIQNLSQFPEVGPPQKHLQRHLNETGQILHRGSLVIMWQVRHLIVKARTNIYVLSNFRKLPKTTITAPSSGEMGVFRVVYPYTYVDLKSKKLTSNFEAVWSQYGLKSLILVHSYLNTI